MAGPPEEILGHWDPMRGGSGVLRFISLGGYSTDSLSGVLEGSIGCSDHGARFG